MQADFHDAHDRHWLDAEVLYRHGRWANADHLYGMAAECGLKRIMLVFDMPYDSIKDRPSKANDCKHVDAIWVRFESYAKGRSDYVLLDNPFTGWDVSQRYAHRSNFTQAYVDPHRQGAEQVRKLVQNAKRDGLI